MEVHADGGKDEPVEDELAEALDADEAAECDDAAEMEAGPDVHVSGRDPLVPPRSDPPAPAQPVMDLPWVALTQKNGKITRFKTDRFTYKSSGRPVGLMLAWMACDVATHTEHTQKAEPLEKLCSSRHEVRCTACLGRRCESPEAVQQGTASR